MALELTQEQKDAGWQVKNLGDITSKIGSGATPRGGKNVYLETGAALIRSQNVHDHKLNLDDVARIDENAEQQLKSVLVQNYDVLLNITGDSIARCAYVPQDIEIAYVNQHVSIIRTNPSEVNYKYLQKYLVSPKVKKQLLDMSDGGTRKALTKGALEGFEIVIPPIGEQKRIAEILGSLDDKIEVNSRLIQSLTELVDAQIIKANEYAAETIKVSDLAVHSKEQTLPSRATDGTVLHYSLPAFDAGAVPAKEEAELILSNKFVLSKPVVLFSKLNPGTPRIWMVEPDAERFNFASTEFVVLEPKEGMGLGALWAACRDPRVSQKLSEFARGTSSSHQRVSPKDILESSVVVADIPEEETTLIRKLTDENVSLAQIRDFLIRYLIG